MMNAQSSLATLCLTAYREVLRTNVDDFGFSLGHDVGLLSRPTELARALKARLIGFRAAAGINWLALAIAVLEARAHA